MSQMKTYKHYDVVVRLPEFNAILYTKIGCERKIWQLRIKPRRGRAIIKSTRTSSLASATEFARKASEIIRVSDAFHLKARLDRNLSDVWAAFVKYHRQANRMSAGRLKTLNGIVECYFLEYSQFKNRSIDAITAETYEWYKEYRIRYWTESNAGLEKLEKNPNLRYSPVPAPSTLNYEHAAFIQIFRWAKQHGYIKDLPPFRAYKHRKGIKKTRGGGIEPNEWAKLVAELYTRAFNPTDEDGRELDLSKSHTHERQVLYFLVVFMGGTMVRPSEAYRLKWRHLRFKQSTLKYGNEDLVIRIPAEVAKTKEERIAVGTNRAAEYMRRWASITPHGDPTDYVFPRYNGERLKDANQSFKKVLAKVNLTHDFDGVKITLYSCRHYSITAALHRKRPILEVSLFAGTSVGHIEKRYYKVDLVKKASEHALQALFDPEDIRAGTEDLNSEPE